MRQREIVFVGQRIGQAEMIAIVGFQGPSVEIIIDIGIERIDMVFHRVDQTIRAVQSDQLVFRIGIAGQIALAQRGVGGDVKTEPALLVSVGQKGGERRIVRNAE